jgi:serine/threonine protein kinase
MHSQNMVHGDLSAVRTLLLVSITHLTQLQGNILISDDANMHVMVCDFDLAAQTSQGASKWQEIGTPNYSSPERLVGVVTFAADLWSWGCLCYTVRFIPSLRSALYS